MSNKFGNVKTVVDGIRFDSKLEAARYRELVLLQRAGEISELRTQVPYRCVVNGSLICKYVADFVFVDRAGNDVIEDTKGVLTAEFRLKAKLMKACNGIDIRLVYAAGLRGTVWKALRSNAK